LDPAGVIKKDYFINNKYSRNIKLEINLDKITFEYLLFVFNIHLRPPPVIIVVGLESPCDQVNF